MGLSASSVNFLRLTSRSHAIELREGMLSNQKLALARESQKISREYNDALSSKVLKWSSNAGMSYTDITYNTLMKPGQMNNYSPFLITDKHDRIVLSGKEVEYAKYMQENDGYDKCRNYLLSKVTGLSDDNIKNLNIKNNNIANAQDKIDKANAKLSNWMKTTQPKSKTAKELAGEIMEKINGRLKNESCDIIADEKNIRDEFPELCSVIKSFMLKHFINIDSGVINNTINGLFGDGSESSGNIQGSIYKACDNINVNAENIKDATFDIIGIFGDNSGSGNSGFIKGGKINVEGMLEYVIQQLLGDEDKYDYYEEKNTTDYLGYNYALNEAKKEYAKAQQSEPNIDAETLKIINFYDQLFKAIEEKGWTENDSVSDSNYLNQMLQNNMYYLTTLDVRVEAADKDTRCKCENCNCCTITTTNYRTQPASNISNVFSVNDKDAREDALVDYEYKKGIINEKEFRIDTQLAKLQTELSAIKQMIQTVKTHADENIQRTFTSRG